MVSTRKKNITPKIHVKKDHQQLNSYEIALANIVDYVYTFDLNGRFTYVNKPLLDLWGITLKEAVGKNFEELGYPPELVKLHDSQIKQVIQTKQLVRGENAYTNFQGEQGYYEYTFVPIFDQKGNVEAIAGSTHDITEKKEKDTIKISAAKANDLYLNALEHESIPVGVLILDGPNYVITFLNSPIAKSWGREKKEVINKPLFEALPELKDQGVKELLNGVYTTGIPYLGSSFPSELLINGKKKVVYYNFVYSPIRNDKGEITGIFVTAVDVTEQNSWEESRLKLAAIVESSDDAIVSKNLDGIITSWNKGAEKIFGYTADEIVGQSIRTLIPPELQREEDYILSQLRQGKKIDHFQTTRISKEGRRLYVSITVSPMKNREGIIVGASKIARDITAEKRLQNQKDEFLSMASHELKTPITSMKIFIYLLSNELENLKHEKSTYYIKRIKDQSNRLSELTNDLLDVSRIQTGKLNLDKAEFNITELVVDTVEGLQGMTKKHKLIFKDDNVVMVFADRYRVYQVLVNLINNAIKYSPQGEKIIISVKEKKNEAVISVKDFGIGIKKEQQPRIFEKLYQVTDPEEKTFPGLGLGLYISKDIVERHKGKIWLESEKGKGAEFYFSLPLAKHAE